jgi:hypothetical protein
MTYRLNLALFVERSTRVDFFAMYYVNAISFLILAYCIHFNKGIDKRISKLILLITILDLIHLMFLAKQGYGMAKTGIAMAILVYEFRQAILDSLGLLYLELLKFTSKTIKYLAGSKAWSFVKKCATKIKIPLKKWRA